MASKDRSFWAILGVAPGAGATQIRRAYARRLKATRPDEDPDGFQALVGARDLALGYAARTNAQVEVPKPAALEDRASLEPWAARAAGPPAPAPADPQDVLDTLRRVLEDGALDDWPTVLRAMSLLAQQQRAQLEPYLVLILSGFAARESSNPTLWPRFKWPFFALLAALDEEFGWSEDDRVVHALLADRAPEDFAAIVRWARSVASLGEADDETDRRRGAPLFALADLYSFYDNGWDRRGLNAYWLMVKYPHLWREDDAAGYLFSPAKGLRNGDLGNAALGLLGWVALLLAFTPWRLIGFGDVMPVLRAKDGLGLIAGILVFVVAIWFVAGSMVRDPKGVLWDSVAFALFPVWALVQRFYARAAMGVLALAAVVYQCNTYEKHQIINALAAVSLALMLHLVAGASGQRWVVYKLRSAVAAADRAGIVSPQQRADVLHRRGARNLWPTRNQRAV